MTHRLLFPARVPTKGPSLCKLAYFAPTLMVTLRNRDGVGGDRLPKDREARTKNERRGGLISSVRAHWGPSCRQQFNTRPCADPAPGYELWVGSQALARASFLKLLAFPHFQLGRKPVSAKIIVCSGAGLNLYAVPITLITAAHHFSHTGKPNSGWPQKEHHRLCD